MTMTAIKWEKEWAEVLTLLFLVLGFILSVLLQSALMSYISITISGFLAGRIYFIKRYKAPLLPVVLIILGFLVGYLIGSIWVNRIFVLLFFTAAFWGSYYLHNHKILPVFKGEQFVK